MSNQSLYLIDTNTVAYCEFCRNVAAFHSSFEARHRLFVINTNSDLANFLSKSVRSFPSATSHPHFRFLEEASSRQIWGPLNFRNDLGSLLEAVTHYCIEKLKLMFVNINVPPHKPTQFTRGKNSETQYRS